MPNRLSHLGAPRSCSEWLPTELTLADSPAQDFTTGGPQPRGDKTPRQKQARFSFSEASPPRHVNGLADTSFDGRLPPPSPRGVWLGKLVLASDLSYKGGGEVSFRSDLRKAGRGVASPPKQEEGGHRCQAATEREHRMTAGDPVCAYFCRSSPLSAWRRPTRKLWIY